MTSLYKNLKENFTGRSKPKFDPTDERLLSWRFAGGTLRLSLCQGRNLTGLPNCVFRSGQYR